MQDNEILSILMTDLQINSPKLNTYLTHLISLAKNAIKEEGINLLETTEDGMLVEMYAAYLYRKRREESASMPRSLRYMLNNRLMSQKAGKADG